MKTYTCFQYTLVGQIKKPSGNYWLFIDVVINVGVLVIHGCIGLTDKNWIQFTESK